MELAAQHVLATCLISGQPTSWTRRGDGSVTARFGAMSIEINPALAATVPVTAIAGHSISIHASLTPNDDWVASSVTLLSRGFTQSTWVATENPVQTISPVLTPLPEPYTPPPAPSAQAPTPPAAPPPSMQAQPAQSVLTAQSAPQHAPTPAPAYTPPAKIAATSGASAPAAPVHPTPAEPQQVPPKASLYGRHTQPSKVDLPEQTASPPSVSLPAETAPTPAPAPVKTGFARFSNNRPSQPARTVAAPAPAPAPSAPSRPPPAPPPAPASSGSAYGRFTSTNRAAPPAQSNAGANARPRFNPGAGDMPEVNF